MHVNEIIIDVQEEEMSADFVASALGFSIVTQADTREELCAMECDSMDCHFGDGAKVMRLLFTREEIISV